MAKKLTPRQELFVREYLKDLNGKQAAIRSGYSPKSAEVQGSTLLRHPKVSEAIAEKNEKRLNSLEVDGKRVISELARIAFADLGQAYDKNGRLKPIHEIPEDTRRAMSGVEVEELWASDGEGGRMPTGDVRKVKFLDKNRSLELLAKNLGLLRDRIEVTGKDGGPLEVKTGGLHAEQRNTLLRAVDSALSGASGTDESGSPPSEDSTPS